MVEIKGVGDARIVTDALRAARLPKRFVIVQSFDPQRAAHRPAPLARRPDRAAQHAAGRGAALRRAANRFTWVAPRWPLTVGYVRFAHALGLRVLPFGVRSAAGVQRALWVSADGLITDDPSAAFRAIVLTVGAAGSGTTRGATAGFG